MFSGSFLPFHLVDNSYWPFCTALGLLGLLYNSVHYWHYGFNYWLVACILVIVLCSYYWWFDVTAEGFNGCHSEEVVNGLGMSMILFILSEVFFFVSFFWSFFHCCWGSQEDLGCSWPPAEFLGIMIDPFSVPFLNTVILLSSGATVTWSHHSFLAQDFFGASLGLVLTFMLGVYFLFLQVCEYSVSVVCINSYVYGSVFILLTGFHGAHVTVGAIFLGVCSLRVLSGDFNSDTHVGFECAAWYWHFVDVVWIFLFFFVYWYSFCLL